MNKKQLGDYLREKISERFPELTFSVDEVRKPQKRYTALIAEYREAGVGACLDLDLLLSELEKGKSLPEVADFAIGILKNGFRDLPGFDVTDLSDYGKCRNRLFAEAIPTAENRELLRTVPHMEILDLSVICRVCIDDHQSATAVVTRDFLEDWGIPEETLLDDTLASAQRLFPLHIDTFRDLCPSLRSDNFPALIAGVRNRYGAAVIAYPDFIEKALKKAGGPFYILPSSVDELLILPESFHPDPEELREMVRRINRTELSPEDRLSDNVYFCDGTSILVT